MLTKLAFKNVGKSMRDYAIYFFTLVLGVSVFYMFNSIYEQQGIMVVTESLTASMVALRKILSIISVFVAVILGFLIVYANNFFIKRRKKELGIYMTLGMTRVKISVILVLETLVMAIIALIVGLLLGIFGSQFMSVFTAKIFEANMTAYKFIFSPEGAVKSIFYFAIIFLTVILFNTIAINKYQLIDLLYGGRKNESLKIRSWGVSVVLFLLAIFCLAIAYQLILKNGIIEINNLFWGSIVLGSVGTLLFFFSLSGILTKLIQANKNLYYKDLNIFVTRQLTSKINTNFISISVVCIVLLLVIGIFASGYSMQNMLSNDLKKSVPYDFSFYSFENEKNTTIYEGLPSSIKDIDVNYHEYEFYHSKNELHYLNFPVDYSALSFDMSKDTPNFVLLSDYNKLLAMQGKEKLSLIENEYFIISMEAAYQGIAQQFLDKQVAITLGNKTLLPKRKGPSTKLSNNEAGILFIVNDTLSATLTKTSDRVLNIVCKSEEGVKELQAKLNQYRESEDYQDKAFSYFLSKEEIYTSSISAKAIISFLAIYLGIVFMVTCAAILAIQQLAQAADNKERYALLRKLGAEKNMLNRALFMQIFCYFLLPLLLAIVHSAVGLTAVNEAIKVLGNVHVTGTIFVTSLFIIVVYGAYFGLTYMASKNIIKDDY